ncbi:MAG: heme-hemopexin-binding/utilization protein, partial [Comamonadaceae bacterium]
MNCSYRSLWNDRTGTFVAVSENACSQGKKVSSGRTASGSSLHLALQTLAWSVALSFAAQAQVLPVGGVVAAGSANISTGAAGTTITQASQNTVINWQSFNIAQGQTVQFVQPNTQAVALNRVLGADPSSILGKLSANGKVFLVNPNGVLFGKGASVNVGGLLASTLNITNSDFLAGNYKFSGGGTGTVLNQGTLNADGGYVALLGANVSNQGVISAQLGSVALAAGSAMTLDVAGDGLLNIAVNESAVNALVQNGGLIRADGGQVLLTTQAAGSLLHNAVNNTGVIQAQTLQNHKGTIKLLGGMQSGTVNVAGQLDASAPHGGDGGFIDTSAAHVKVADNTLVTTQSAQGQTGTWLIDPPDFTVAAGSDIAGVTLSGNLVTTNITILSSNGIAGVNGDVNINEAVTWTASGAPTTLTLTAVNDVNFNAAVTATKGSLVATAGRDVLVKAGVTGITTTNGSITWTATRDININAPVTTTDGNFTACCGRDINISAAMTTTRGNVTLKAGSDGTGPAGLIGGTVFFAPATPSYAVTGPGAAVTLDYTPTSYATPNNYAGNFTLTGGATLTQHMLVFAQGVDKVYDGNTTATLAFKGTPTLGGVVTLVPGTATFDSKDVAANIGITHTGYSLGGVDAGLFALWAACVPGIERTSAAITPRPMSILADSASKVYGQTFAPATSAFTTPVPPIAGETVLSVTETSTGSPATASVAGSTYPIIPSAALANGAFLPGNYTITYLNGALTVTPAPLTVTADNAAKTYGQTTVLPTTAFTSVGLLNGDTVTAVTETSPGTVATAPVAGSPYVITPSGATGTYVPSNYTVSYVNGVLTVTPAPLTVTADNAAKTYGQTTVLPTTAFTSAGLLNGDTVTAVTETSPGTVATAPVAGSPYAITPSGATGTYVPSNYTVSYV